MTATDASTGTGYALGEFQEQFAAARLWASVRRPYFAAALFAMTPIVRGGSGTASVDRAWRLYLDPCIFEQWTVEELGAVLLHEIGHLLRDHLGRGEELVIGPSTERLWNYACDAEINDDLVAEGLPLPQPLLPRHAKLPDHLLAEEYYRRWPREPNNEDHTDCGSGVHGQTRPWELDDNDPAYERVHAWEADLIRRQVAVGIRTDPGKIPAGWRRWAESTLRPTVDWKRALGSSVRRAISNVAGAVDYSYARPSRRASISPTVILPALRRPVPQIAVVCDTSGSVDDQLLGLVLAELEGILRHAGAASRNVWVLACDAAVHSAQRISSTHDVQLLGGGGTDMRAGIDAALALCPRPEIIVVLTDGQTLWGSGPPRARVVIGLLGTPTLATPAWASVVRIPVDAAL